MCVVSIDYNRLRFVIDDDDDELNGRRKNLINFHKEEDSIAF